MTTTKTEKKVPATETKEAPKQEDLRVAYEIHTLAQLLYREMAMTHPWVPPPSPLIHFETAKGRSPFTAFGAGPSSVPAQWPW